MKITLSKSHDARSTAIVMPTALYESIRDFIITMLTEKEEITFYDLLDEAMNDKSIGLERDLSWYLLQVKRDLEAKDVIKVTLSAKPSLIQTIRLKKKKRAYLRSDYK